MRFDAWNYRPDSGWTTGFDLIGYHLEATDGRLGKISEVAHAHDASFLVVDTGPWLFGHRVKSAPDFDPDMCGEQTYRDKVDGYYRDTYAG